MLTEGCYPVPKYALINGAILQRLRSDMGHQERSTPGEDSHMKGAGMLVVSLKVFSGKNVIIFSREGLV